MGEEFYNTVENICEREFRYKLDAYAFVMEALSFTQRKFRCLRHVTGSELLEGIRELLLTKFGPMTMTVLEYWGIKSTEDFGNIIFHLVENNVLSKTEEDNIETFRNGFDFREVFDRSYREQLAKKISRMRTM